MYTKKSFTQSVLIRLFKTYLFPYKISLVVSILFILIATGALLTQVKLVQPAVNNIFEKGAQDFSLLIIIAFVLFFAIVIRALANYSQRIILGRIGLRIVMTLQSQILEKFMEMDIAYFDQHGTARQLSRFTTDTYIVRDTLTNVAPGIIANVITLTGLVILTFTLNVWLALISFLLLPLLAIIIYFFGRIIRRYTHAFQENMGEAVKQLDDALKGMHEIKSFVIHKQVTKRLHTNFQHIYRSLFKIMIIQEINRPIVQILIGIIVFVVIFVGGIEIHYKLTTVGAEMSLFFAIATMSQPLKSLGNSYAELQKAITASSSIFELLDTQPTIVNIKGAKPLIVTQGRIEFHHVGFTYQTKRTVALHDIQAIYEPQKKHAIVGESGAGKTTLFKLLMRFYDPISGEIYIDGQSIQKVTLESLRESIAYIGQDNWFFSGTLLENIKLGDPNASEEAVYTALTHAQALEFVKELPEGLHTFIGERGQKLSGGQRQRVAIARTILKDAPIVLLDEATSALDTETEIQVQQGLEYLLQNRTTFIIAHRIATIANVDTITLMNKGNIVDMGQKEEMAIRYNLFEEIKKRQNVIKNVYS